MALSESAVVFKRERPLRPAGWRLVVEESGRSVRRDSGALIVGFAFGRVRGAQGSPAPELVVREVAARGG